MFSFFHFKSIVIEKNFIMKQQMKMYDSKGKKTESCMGYHWKW